MSQGTAAAGLAAHGVESAQNVPAEKRSVFARQDVQRLLAEIGGGAEEPVECRRESRNVPRPDGIEQKSLAAAQYRRNRPLFLTRTMPRRAV